MCNVGISLYPSLAFWPRSENYNYGKSVFKSSVIEEIALKASLYGIETKYVNPRG
jgi:hypothetical protein